MMKFYIRIIGLTISSWLMFFGVNYEKIPIIFGGLFAYVIFIPMLPKDFMYESQPSEVPKK